MKQLNTMIEEKYFKKLKILAVSEEVSIQTLIEEAIKDLFTKRRILIDE